ncbi:hypothetical protein RJ639_030302 [Escallonia herrerae]|uniref:Reverse transcriptase/retrotransposon-derived protein RNase H-like domain-containing protein n=1 Tax=Escallonia herrerae TaxID=1293975 RepID=A0AA88XGD4_9ASTE|nr:hypothetical protein RJ639_030302 [Escallonia herrerae]
MDDRMSSFLRSFKEYLSSPLLLSKPIVEEELFLYLAVAESTVSSMLIQEQDSKQLPIYYVSKVLQGVELRYPNTEKLAFALLTAAGKLRPYFQSYSIIVFTNKPLRQILHKPDLSSQLGQALADFIINCTLPLEDKDPLVRFNKRISSRGHSTLMAPLTRMEAEQN